jgi:hypothetical protein
MQIFGIDHGALIMAKGNERPFIPGLRRSNDFDVTSNKPSLFSSL